MNKNDIIKLFSAFSGLIKQMNDEEFSAFLDGGLDIKFQQKMKIQEENHPNISAYDALTKALDATGDRESARAFLLYSPMGKTRDSLEKYAKYISIHINKSDKKDEIVAKIIESRVGLRLRTEAIQAVNFGCGNVSDKK